MVQSSSAAAVKGPQVHMTRREVRASLESLAKRDLGGGGDNLMLTWLLMNDGQFVGYSTLVTVVTALLGLMAVHGLATASLQS